jgi:hydrogenase maturation factor HypF (carbamoyltransferase family)
MHERSVSARHIYIRGVVQGVGFRSFVCNLAAGLGLSGWVLNSFSGVEIETIGPGYVLDEFVERLVTDAPPLARIEYISATAVPLSAVDVPDPDRFVIRRSLSERDTAGNG